MPVHGSCILVLTVFGPLLALALLVGPVAAWLLHNRRIDRTAVVGGGIGIATGLVTVGGMFFLLSLVAGALGPVGGWEFTVPVAILAIVSTMFFALVIALDIDSVRDLLPARRTHSPGPGTSGLNGSCCSVRGGRELRAGEQPGE